MGKMDVHPEIYSNYLCTCKATANTVAILFKEASGHLVIPRMMLLTTGTHWWSVVVTSRVTSGHRWSVAVSGGHWCSVLTRCALPVDNHWTDKYSVCCWPPLLI